jgi:hypothetical protein
VRFPLAPLAVVVAVGLGATAFAQDGQSEPEITAASVLRLTSAQACVRPARVTVRALPPAGVELELLRVAVDGVIATRMSHVPHAASVTVGIPQGTSRLRVTIRTPGGQEAHADRRYRACAPRPPAKPPSGRIISRGGGED